MLHFSTIRRLMFKYFLIAHNYGSSRVAVTEIPCTLLPVSSVSVDTDNAINTHFNIFDSMNTKRRFKVKDLVRLISNGV